MNTILITGSSSGFGLETARYFLDRDWTVIATMCAPREDVLPASELLHVVALDVTDAASIARAVEQAGPIDALVNNAGAGLMGALEGVSIDATRQLFELNTFGTMAMTQAVLPGFRAQQGPDMRRNGFAHRKNPIRGLERQTLVEAMQEPVALEEAVHLVLARSPVVNEKDAREPEELWQNRELVPLDLARHFLTTNDPPYLRRMPERCQEKAQGHRLRNLLRGGVDLRWIGSHHRQEVDPAPLEDGVVHASRLAIADLVDPDQQHGEGFRMSRKDQAHVSLDAAELLSSMVHGMEQDEAC